MMPENPLRNPGHRRFFSELPSSSLDAYFGSDLASANGCTNDAGNNFFVSNDIVDDEAFAKLFELYEPDSSSLGTAQLNDNVSEPMPPLPSMQPAPTSCELGTGSIPGLVFVGPCTQKMENPMYQCSQSKDKVADGSSIATGYAKRTLLNSRKSHYSPIELAEISLVDPRHAKRILTQTKSVAKVKEMKEKYKIELEHKFQYLQSTVASINTQLVMVKHDVSNLTAENKMLHLRLQAIEQHLNLQGTLHEMLNGEIERLKLLTDEATNVGMGQG